jgi:hypothetical protein
MKAEDAENTRDIIEMPDLWETNVAYSAHCS